MKINGEEYKLDKEISLKQLLSDNGYRMERIAVELNGEIVPKSEYESRMVSESDCLEVVSFVGGG